MNAHLAFDDASAADDTPGHVAALGQGKNLAHLRGADHDFFNQRIQQARHRFFHFVDQFVNDGVEFDLHRFAFGHVRHPVVHAGVKPEHNRVGGRRQEHVGFGDGADGAVDDVERDVLRLDFFERLNDGLDRTLGVGLHDRLKNLAGL